MEYICTQSPGGGPELTPPNGVDKIASMLFQLVDSSMADWVGAIGTTAAFFVAALAYRQDVWHRNRAQARLVDVSLESFDDIEAGQTVDAQFGVLVPMNLIEQDSMFESRITFAKNVKLVTVKVHNHSSEIVLMLFVSVYTDETTKSLPPEMGLPSGALAPHQDREFQFFIEDFGIADIVSARVLYSDSLGVWWDRSSSGRVYRNRRMTRRVRRNERRERRSWLWKRWTTVFQRRRVARDNERRAYEILAKLENDEDCQ